MKRPVRPVSSPRAVRPLPPDFCVMARMALPSGVDAGSIKAARSELSMCLRQILHSRECRVVLNSFLCFLFKELLSIS